MSYIQTGATEQEQIQAQQRDMMTKHFAEQTNREAELQRRAEGAPWDSRNKYHTLWTLGLVLFGIVVVPRLLGKKAWWSK